MKIIIFAALIAQVLAGSTKLTSRGIIDSFLLSTPNRICLCRCGLPNRDGRSVDVKKIEVNVDGDADVKHVSFPDATETDAVSDAGSNAKTLRGKEQPGQSKLIGGDVPESLTFPWLVLVMAKGDIVAGGALISENHVITSASPIAKEVNYDVKVRLAVHDRCVGDVTSSNISVEALIIHPEYSPASDAHNIALLRLAVTFRLDRRIRSICLPNPLTDYSGSVATVVSWLSPTPTGGDPSCEPHRIRQPILPDGDCTKAVTSGNLLSPNKSCIGTVGASTLICAGDIGVPVQVMGSSGKYELVGIISLGNECGVTNTTIFTKVADYLSWIMPVMAKDCLCRI